MSPPDLHPQALVDHGAIVGAQTRVWAFAHVCDGAVIGEDCNLCDHTFFEKGVRLGNRVTIKCGVYLWDGVTLEDDVFVGPCVAFTNDLRPRSKKYPDQFLKTHLQQGCSVGANATLLPVTIGRWAMVAAGAVVTNDVPPHALVRGNPARLVGWVCRCGQELAFDRPNASCACGRHFQINSETCIMETGFACREGKLQADTNKEQGADSPHEGTEDTKISKANMLTTGHLLKTNFKCTN